MSPDIITFTDVIRMVMALKVVFQHVVCVVIKFTTTCLTFRQVQQEYSLIAPVVVYGTITPSWDLILLAPPIPVCRTIENLTAFRPAFMVHTAGAWQMVRTDGIGTILMACTSMAQRRVIQRFREEMRLLLSERLWCRTLT